jgi:hypothetical protein
MDVVMHILLLIYFALRLIGLLLKSDVLLVMYIDTLVVATIVCCLRFMNVFAGSKSLGPLFFVIIRLFKDVAQWLFIFLLFVIGFQVGIFVFTRQTGHSGWQFYPEGSMGAAFTAILGELGDNTMAWMHETRFGVLVVLLYSLVTQVILVNLLIAMMGNTYSMVKDNSDKEWKFYRYKLIADYNASSVWPIPLNVIYFTISSLRKCCSVPRDDSEKQEMQTNMVTKTLTDATSKAIVEQESQVRNSLPQISASLHERMRILAANQDNDRLYLEGKIEALENRMDTMLNILQRLIEKSPPT